MRRARSAARLCSYCISPAVIVCMGGIVLLVKYALTLSAKVTAINLSTLLLFLCKDRVMQVCKISTYHDDMMTDGT